MKNLKTLISVCLACTMPVVSVSATDVREHAAETITREADTIATAAPVVRIEDNKTLSELPVEFSEPDPSKAERFIIKYKGKKQAIKPKISSRYAVKSVETMEIENKAEVSQLQLLELEKAVDIEAFKTELSRGYDIDYIQPDYRLDLSATDLEKADRIEEAEAVNDEIITPFNADFGALEGSEEQETFTENDDDFENSTVVAIIDTGIDIENTNFNLFTNINDNGNDEDENGYSGDIHGWDFVNNSSSVYNPSLGLEQAHGTHIAGVIAETAPNAEIMPLKVFENGIAYTSDIIEAIQYADMMGANIVNCSWGCTDENLALKETMENTDMLFVCAAGNNRLDLTETPIYPACYELVNIISVTSVNADGGLSYFSNYGGVDIAALGRNVEGVFPGGNSGTLTGTSVSAGFVSGALASVYTNAEDTVERLYNTADKLLNLQEHVTDGRRLNLDALLSNTPNNEIIDVDPEEDFNTECYSRTPAESWALFSELENVEVEAGRYFFVVLKANGSVWTWGKNNNGQLGLGHYNSVYTPQQVPSISDVVEIAAGQEHVVVRTNQNYAYTWGSNSCGCLGIGSTTRSNVPVQMTNGTNITGIGAGSYNTYVLKSGAVYTCSKNGWGAIGDGTTTNRTTLTDINLSGIEKITGNEGATFAISNTGALYSWGHDGHGRLGDGGGETDRLLPQIIISSGITDVSMGFFDCMALTDTGTVYNWGYSYGTSPVLRNDISNVSKITAARQAQFVLQGNTIKSKGMNTNGALGVGDTSWHTSWTNVTGDFTDFDIYEYMGIAVGTNGCIYTWGITNVEEETYITAPIKVSGRINNFAGDYFDDAVEVDEGLIYGSIQSEGDYYKFTPTESGLYSIYSISNCDLVCEISISNSDETYTLLFSNDDSNAKSSNIYDFYIINNFTANTDYYICVYPYQDITGEEYCMYITHEESQLQNSFEMNVQNGNKYVFAVTANEITSINDAEFTVTYDSTKLSLTDACALTWNKVLSTGSVTGTNIQITQLTSSSVKFNVSYTQNIVTGTVNLIEFTANGTGTAEITVELAQ